MGAKTSEQTTFMSFVTPVRMVRLQAVAEDVAPRCNPGPHLFCLFQPGRGSFQLFARDHRADIALLVQRVPTLRRAGSGHEFLDKLVITEPVDENSLNRNANLAGIGKAADDTTSHCRIHIGIDLYYGR